MGGIGDRHCHGKYGIVENQNEPGLAGSSNPCAIGSASQHQHILKWKSGMPSHRSSKSIRSSIWIPGFGPDNQSPKQRTLQSWWFRDFDPVLDGSTLVGRFSNSPTDIDISELEQQQYFIEYTVKGVVTDATIEQIATLATTFRVQEVDAQGQNGAIRTRTRRSHVPIVAQHAEIVISAYHLFSRAPASGDKPTDASFELWVEPNVGGVSSLSFDTIAEVKFWLLS